MRNVINVLITAVLLVVMTGCGDSAKQPVVGVVTSETRIIGKTAPNFNFTSAEGKVTSFKKVSQPISIIAFTSSGDVCCELNPQLVELANRFRGYPISVSQVSLPTDNCPYGPGCTEQCKIVDINLISLCDKDLVAWEVYDQPKPGTVILIDSKSQIVAVDSLDSLDAVASKAERIAREYTKSYDSMYKGG